MAEEFLTRFSRETGPAIFRSEVLGFFLELAWGMGRISGQYFGQLGNEDVHNKEGHLDDPVTAADLAVRDYLVPTIAKSDFASRVQLLSEESVGREFEYDHNKKLFIIDELDGSKNFSEGNKNYCHLLAMAEPSENGPVVTVGLVYRPQTDEMWFATTESDFTHLREGKKADLAPLLDDTFIPGFTPLSSPDDAATFPINHMEKYGDVIRVWDMIREENREQTEIYDSNCGGLSILDVACGNTDAFFVPKLANWDIAASAFLLRKRGGNAYIAKSLDDVMSVKKWGLQMESPAEYYPAWFTNGKIDDSLHNYMRPLINATR